MNNKLVWTFEDIDGNLYAAQAATSFGAKMDLRKSGITCKLFTLWQVPISAKPF